MAYRNEKKSCEKKTISGKGNSRRSFLFLASTAVVANFLTVFTARAVVKMPAGMPMCSVSDFQEISQFLTGKTLSPQLAGRAWWALENHDAAFGVKYKALRDFIIASRAETIDRLKTDKAFNGEVRHTAMCIISAYYLGYAGTPRPLRAHDDTIFITYTQALMYRLNYEYVPIPTYSRWEEGFWSNPAVPR